jgi:hypothetical protein
VSEMCAVPLIGVDSRLSARTQQLSNCMYIASSVAVDGNVSNAQGQETCNLFMQMRFGKQ